MILDRAVSAPVSALVAMFWVTGCVTTPETVKRQVDLPLRVPSEQRTVVVDAGHGGDDPGAIGNGLVEKDLALDIALRLANELQGKGLNVVLSRQQDRFIPLRARSAQANQLGADLFVSIHVNANRDSEVQGSEVYYALESVVDDHVGWPPFVAAHEVVGGDATGRSILWDLVLRRSRAESSRIASAVCQGLQLRLQGSCKTLEAQFAVLREAWMPAVLIEVGYLSHREEAQKLSQDGYRQSAAEAIAKSIMDTVGETARRAI